MSNEGSLFLLFIPILRMVLVESESLRVWKSYLWRVCIENRSRAGKTRQNSFLHEVLQERHTRKLHLNSLGWKWEIHQAVISHEQTGWHKGVRQRAVQGASRPISLEIQCDRMGVGVEEKKMHSVDLLAIAENGQSHYQSDWNHSHSFTFKEKVF